MILGIETNKNNLETGWSKNIFTLDISITQRTGKIDFTGLLTRVLRTATLDMKYTEQQKILLNYILIKSSLLQNKVFVKQ